MTGKWFHKDRLKKGMILCILPFIWMDGNISVPIFWFLPKHRYSLCFTFAFPGTNRKGISFHLQNDFLLNWYWSDSYLVIKRKTGTRVTAFPYSKKVSRRYLNRSWLIIIIFSPKLPLKTWFSGFHFGCSYIWATKSRFLFQAKEHIAQPPAILRHESEDKIVKCTDEFFYPTQIIHRFIFTSYPLLYSSLKDVSLGIGNLIWHFGKTFPVPSKMV